MAQPALPLNPLGALPMAVPEEAREVLGWSGEALPGAYPAIAR